MFKFINLSRYGSYLLLLMSISLVTACGFHLRTQALFPTALNPLYVQSGQPYSALTLELKQILQSQDIKLVDRRKDAKYTLEIRDQSTSTATLSQSASSSTTQYILYYHVAYAITRQDGTVVFGPKTITSQRNYTVNQAQVLSSDSQVASLTAEMQHDTISLMFDQLSSQDALSKIQ
jgi:LPS-assembly lipoprotein